MNETGLPNLCLLLRRVCLGRCSRQANMGRRSRQADSCRRPLWTNFGWMSRRTDSQDGSTQTKGRDGPHKPKA